MEGKAMVWLNQSGGRDRDVPSFVMDLSLAFFPPKAGHVLGGSSKLPLGGPVVLSSEIDALPEDVDDALPEMEPPPLWPSKFELACCLGCDGSFRLPVHVELCRNCNCQPYHVEDV